MKKRTILAIFITFTLLGVCFARFERWPVVQKPEVTMAKAEAIGDQAIGSKYKGYFCVGARFASLGDKEGEWWLSYTNSNGDRKWVAVDHKGGSTVHETERNL